MAAATVTLFVGRYTFGCRIKPRPAKNCILCNIAINEGDWQNAGFYGKIALKKVRFPVVIFKYTIKISFHIQYLTHFFKKITIV